MKKTCGVTGCPNQTWVKCNLCGLPLCKKHTFTLFVDGKELFLCRGCYVYLKAKSGETAFAGKGGLEYGDGRS